MGSSRNRVAGHNWERVCAQKWRSMGYLGVLTSRECSRLRDSQKVDLSNADEDVDGRLPYNIQCKTLSSSAPYSKLLRELEENNKGPQINVVVHKMTKKSGVKFMTVGEYAILNLTDFYRMAEKILHYETALTESGASNDFMNDTINKKL